MLRLLRLTRMVRLIRAVPDLVTLLRSMTVAFRSVFSTMILLLIFIYLFAVMFRSQLRVDSSTPLETRIFLQQKMSRLPSIMWTLLFSGTFLDSPAKCAVNLVEVSTPLALAFVVFAICTAFVLLNMLVGLLCQVVNEVSSVEKERNTITYVKSKLMGVLQSLDTDGNGTISKEEFNQLLKNEEAVQALEELGVDVPNLLSLSDHLFEPSDALPAVGTCLTKNSDASTPSSSETVSETSPHITFADFMERVICLRPTKSPSGVDIVELRKLILGSQRNLLRRLDALEDTGHGLRSQVQSMQALARRFSTEESAAALAPLLLQTQSSEMQRPKEDQSVTCGGKRAIQRGTPKQSVRSVVASPTSPLCSRKRRADGNSEASRKPTETSLLL